MAKYLRATLGLPGRGWIWGTGYNTPSEFNLGEQLLNKAVFVDRDGVVNVHRRDSVKSWEEFRFLPGVFQACARLTQAGLPIVVVTNQAVIARGTITPEELDEIHQRMVDAIRRNGGDVLKVLYCPHGPDEGCECRKPRSGLLWQAASELNIDLKQSYLIGDSIGDLLAGQNAGCRTILVLTGLGWMHFLSKDGRRLGGYRVARDLRAAAAIILNTESLGKLSWRDKLFGRFLFLCRSLFFPARA